MNRRYVYIILSSAIVMLIFSVAMQVSFGAKTSKTSGYIFPLKRVYYISSSFGEFRENHFHAGIDFTTRMRIGEPVYAVNDGEIFRVKYQFRGYGKTLYLRHDGGIISVYAHLDRFENDKLKLENLLKNYQQLEHKKYVDIYLEKETIRVKKGQLIAYSGETGEGLPHLHLELRKGEENPVNPFNDFYRETKDRTPPKIQGFVLCPADPDSYVDSMKRCQSFSLKKKKGIYQTDRVPVIQGKFKISVSVFDRAESIYWRSPKYIWFYVNDKLAFEVTSTIFSFAENRSFGFLHDQGMHGYEHFNIPIWLCNPLAKRLAMVKSFDESLCKLDFNEGRQILKVVTTDANGNKSTALFPILIANTPEVKLTADHTTMQACVSIKDKKSGELLNESLSPESMKMEYWDFTEEIFKEYKPSLENSSCGKMFVIPAVLQNNYYIRLSFFNGEQWSPWEIIHHFDYELLLPKKSGNKDDAAGENDDRLPLTWRVDYGRQSVSLSTQLSLNAPFSFKGECVYSNKGRQDMQFYYPLDRHVSTTIKTKPVIGNLNCRIEDEFGRGAWDFSWELNFVEKGQSATLRWKEVKAVVPGESVSETSYVWLERIVPRQTEYLPVIGNVLQFHPRGMYFPRRALVKFKVPDGLKETEKLSLYRWSRKQNRWKTILSWYDAREKTIEGHVHYFDRIAMILDNAKPVFLPLVPYQNQVLKKSPKKLIVRIEEKGMGLDEDALLVTLDYQKVVAEYDPDRDITYITLSETLQPGSHSLRVEGRDYAMNVALPLIINFTVK